MACRAWAYLAIVALAACSSSRAPAKGRLVVAVTIDWEGVYFAPDGLDALDELRTSLGAAPVTHFVSAAYFTKDRPDPAAVGSLAQAVRPGDELAVHVHAWRSLARAAGVEPKLSPSFITGTDKLLEFEDGDLGFDTDLDVYSVSELRALIRTSRRLLEQTRLPVSKTFRAGGYLGTPKVIQAIREEGFVVDSSATDYRQVDARKDTFLSRRVREIWPKLDAGTQPFFLDGPARQVVEMPITATADYVTAAELTALFEAAEARLHKDPDRDVFVVIGFNLETAGEFAGRIGETIQKLRARREVAERVLLTTVEHAATLARSALSGGTPATQPI